ncbi:MAG: thrombospondin type 3 repeat-containing protein [Gammaproteobacteria bacterium]|nr:thrombospondin type 3 repeat-containing protein [Gammaproteobacteria bacterium]
MIRSTALIIAIAVAQGAFARGDLPGRAPGTLTQNFAPSPYSVEVTADFAEVSNLSASSLGLTAQVIAPIDMPGIVLRLPAAGVTIPAAFPVIVDITPPALGGLEFEGVAMVILDTPDLPYSPYSRLRLFSAHDGGPFVDITEEFSEGSYRVRGSQGEFSEFLIVLDERDPAAIVTTKFARLSALIATHTIAIDDTVEATLNGLLGSAQASFTVNDIDAAKVDIAAFEAAVAATTSGQVPNVWRSLEDVTNVNGLLRAAAGTLYFSLEDARDTDLDGLYDWQDNCRDIANPAQCDTDGDGFGNICDGDFDGNNIINSFDLTAMRNAFGSAGVTDTDLDCDGMTNSFDLSLFRELFGSPPGPGIP